MARFKSYFLNEELSYLGHKVGDVLGGVNSIQDDMPNLGSRHLTRLAEDIVVQIRKILHDRWSPRYKKHLESLQKVAVAIMRTIDRKGDLREVVPVAAAALQNLSVKLGVKVNDLDAPAQDASQADFQLTAPAQGVNERQ